MQAITYLIMMVLMPTSKEQENHKGWRARLKLEFKPGHRRTILGTCKHYGPLTRSSVLFILKMEPATSTSCIRPEAWLEAICLNLTLVLNQGVFALITTPEATKFDRSTGAVSAQKQDIVVRAGVGIELRRAQPIGGEFPTRTLSVCAAGF